MSKESQILGERCLRGDAEAERQVFQRYMRRLTALARNRLVPAVGRRVDPDDAVQSAFRSFFLGARTGEFALRDGEGLWKLLATITARKAARLNKRHGAVKRNARRDTPMAEHFDAMGGADPALDRGPTPEHAAVLADELSLLMSSLDHEHRIVLEMGLQDASIDMIAKSLGKSARTIRRRLEELESIVARQLDVPPSDGRKPARVPKAPSRRRAPSDGESRVVDYRDYVLQLHLGSGGVGKVYRVWRRSDDATLAMKVLRKRFCSCPEAIERFLNEYAVMSDWQHPGIVRVHGQGATPSGAKFFLMDMLAGGSLSQLSVGTYDAEQVRNWMLQIIDALQYSHRHGVVHCDLKPSNVLLDAAGRAILVDFGFAQFMNRVALADGATPAFAAPELLDSTIGPISSATDVWGVGAILYWLIERRTPAEINTADGCRNETQLQRAIAHCLQASPFDRPSLGDLRALTDHT